MSIMQDNWCLTVQVGENIPRDYEIKTSEITIGRAMESDIRIDSNLMSRGSVHGRFVYHNQQWFYEDLGSTNGTIIDGKLYWSQRGQPSGLISVQDGTILDVDADRRGDCSKGVRICIKRGMPCRYEQILLKENGDTLIGRGEQCDVRLSHIRVSRKHAVIHGKNGQYEIESFENTSGVFLNGRQVIGRVKLTVRDALYISGFLLLFANGKLYKKSEATGKGGVVLQVRNIVRTKKGKLNNVSFDVHKGELVAIIGTSGAGKSTLLNAIHGADRPESGSVFYNGQDVFNNYELLKDQIGFVPQKDVMQQELTLKDMLLYAAKIRLNKDVSAKDREKRVDDVMKTLSISDAAKTMLKKTSGGQKKRANIAIEMLSDPSLFFLDEPTSGLDPGTEHHLMETLRQLADSGKTVVLVTHTPLTLPICDKVVVMGNEGNMTYYGSPEEALRFFGVKSFVEVYDLVDSASKAREWAKRFEQQRGELSKPKRITGKKKRKKAISFFGQTWTLFCRQMKVIANQPISILTTLLIIGAVGIVVSLIKSDGTYNTYNDTYKMLFTMAIAGMFLGVLRANGEIVSERDILYREHMANLRLGTYVFSKVLVMFILSLLQSIIFVAIIGLVIGIPSNSLMFSPVVETWITIFLTMFSSSCLGLLISALGPRIENALTFLTLALVPQIVFGGPVFKLEGITRGIANFIHVFWGTNALAISINLEDMDMEEVVVEKGMQAGTEFVADTPVKEYLESTIPNLTRSWEMLLILGLLSTLLCLLVLKINAKKYKD